MEENNYDDLIDFKLQLQKALLEVEDDHVINIKHLLKLKLYMGYMDLNRLFVEDFVSQLKTRKFGEVLYEQLEGQTFVFLKDIEKGMDHDKLFNELKYAYIFVVVLSLMHVSYSQEGARNIIGPSGKNSTTIIMFVIGIWGVKTVLDMAFDVIQPRGGDGDEEFHQQVKNQFYLLRKAALGEYILYTEDTSF